MFTPGRPSNDPRHPDYVPSIFSFKTPQSTDSSFARLNRLKNRTIRKEIRAHGLDQTEGANRKCKQKKVKQTEGECSQDDTEFQSYHRKKLRSARTAAGGKCKRQRTQKVVSNDQEEVVNENQGTDHQQEDQERVTVIRKK